MKTKDQSFLTEKKVLSYCEHYRMLEAGDRVIAGVSGGADSVCLLFLLCTFQRRLPFSLRVVHIHHGIREDADGDAAYVKKLCEKLELPFLLIRSNVPEIAKRDGLSEEEAGRRVRYQAFREAADAWNGELPSRDIKSPVKIALAHHMGDRAETLLFHLFRGSGLKGLGSIPPLRLTEEGHQIIRPLLCLQRFEIEEYLSERDISFCQDSTNFEDEYARNRIRHHILSYVEQEICQGATRHLNETAQLLSETEEYLQAQTQEALGSCVTAVEAGEGSMDLQIDIARFLGLHGLMQKRVLLALLVELSPGRKDIGLVHVEAVQRLIEGKSTGCLNLPFGIFAEKIYDRMLLRRGAALESREKALPGQCRIPLREILERGQACCPWGQKTFLFCLSEHKKVEGITEKIYTKEFDYDKIKNTLFLRTRGPGDYIMIRDAEGTPVRKTLKEYFIGEKIPRQMRDAIPLLAEGKHILWIVGYRISEGYKVDENTKKVLSVRIMQADGEECPVHEIPKGGNDGAANSCYEIGERGGCPDSGAGRADQQGL